MVVKQFVASGSGKYPNLIAVFVFTGLTSQVEEDMANASVQEDDTYVIHGPKSTIPISDETLGKNILNALLNAPQDAVAMVS